jgi:hypothetical protein
MSFAADNFDRGDSVGSLGFTSTGGYSWQSFNSTWDIGAISALSPPAAGSLPAIAVINIGEPDQDIIVQSQYSNDFTGLVARFSDANNYLAFVTHGDGSTWPKLFLYSCIAGVISIIDSLAFDSFTDDFIRLKVEGNNAFCYINGVLKLSGTVPSALATNTKCGMIIFQRPASDAHLDNFQVTGSSSAPSGTVFFKTINDFQAISDSLSFAAPIRKTLTDSLAFPDFLGQITTHLTNSYNDVFGIVDSLVLNTLSKGTADNLQLFEILSVIGPRFTRNFGDTLNFVDDITRFGYQLADSITFIDVIESPRYLKQAFIINDTLTFVKLKNPLIDHLSFVDAICILGNISRTLSDNLIFGERYSLYGPDQIGDPTIPVTGIIIHAKYTKRMKDFLGFNEATTIFGGMIPSDCGFIPNVQRSGGQLLDVFTFGEVFFAINLPLNKNLWRQYSL